MPTTLALPPTGLPCAVAALATARDVALYLQHTLRRSLRPFARAAGAYTATFVPHTLPRFYGACVTSPDYLRAALLRATAPAAFPLPSHGSRRTYPRYPHTHIYCEHKFSGQTTDINCNLPPTCGVVGPAAPPACPSAPIINTFPLYACIPALTSPGHSTFHLSRLMQAYPAWWEAGRRKVTMGGMGGSNLTVPTSSCSCMPCHTITM